MSDVEQHIEVSVVVSGKNKVAFNTDFGWVSGMAMQGLDALSVESAIKGVNDFLKTLDVVPFENMCENEEYVEDAEDTLSEFIDLIADISDISEEISFSHSEHLQFLVTMKPSYEVNFG